MAQGLLQVQEALLLGKQLVHMWLPQEGVVRLEHVWGHMLPQLAEALP
jgi:hypothetical protein